MSEKWKYLSIKNINLLLNEKNGAPLKKWGQNFLVDSNIIDFIFQIAVENNVSDYESLIEIGPGLGAITHRLIPYNKKTYLFEIDPILIETLSIENFDKLPFTLIAGDVLENLDKLPESSFFCFGNLPYYISSEILTSIFRVNRNINVGIFMLQKEFVERIISGKSSLSIFLNAFGNWRLLKNISPNCFYPIPKAASSLLLFKKFESRILLENELKALETILRGFFWGKRKTISKSLKDNPFFKNRFRDRVSEVLESSEILTGMERPEEISKEKYYQLAKLVAMNNYD